MEEPRAEQPKDDRRDAEEAMSTDQMLEVFEHVAKTEVPWEQYMADHGLHPVNANRALVCWFPDAPHGKLQRAFIFGLQFGAMRLDPVTYRAPAKDTCNCPLCQFRRQLEAEFEEGGGSSDAP